MQWVDEQLDLEVLLFVLVVRTSQKGFGFMVFGVWGLGGSML